MQIAWPSSFMHTASHMNASEFSAILQENDRRKAFSSTTRRQGEQRGYLLSFVSIKGKLGEITDSRRVALIEFSRSEFSRIQRGLGIVVVEIVRGRDDLVTVTSLELPPFWSPGRLPLGVNEVQLQVHALVIAICQTQGERVAVTQPQLQCGARKFQCLDGFFFRFDLQNPALSCANRLLGHCFEVGEQQ